MAFKTSAQASTVQQMGPDLSMLQLKPIVEGEIIEPSVSVPSQKPTNPVDVDYADPADEALEFALHVHAAAPDNGRA